MLILNGQRQPHLALNVGTFRELPEARGRAGMAARVQRPSGLPLLNRRRAGVYVSTGKKWQWVTP